MSAFRMMLAIASTCVLGWNTSSAYAVETTPLLQTSNFNGTFVTEETTFLRLTADPGKMVSLYAQLPVSGLKALQLSYNIRYDNVARGEKPWHDARIILQFKGSDGHQVSPSPPAPYYTGTSASWKKENLRFPVPAGATVLSVMPAMFQAANGTCDITNIELVAIDPATLPPIQHDVGGALVVQVDGNRKPPSPLRVEGKNILDTAGQAVWLQGVSVPSLEWSNTGESVAASIVAAIDTWKASVIRLPITDDRWFGKKDQSDGGTAYRAVVNQAVIAASSRGAYIILDLHRYRAPTDDAVIFWKAVADVYKDHPAVLFGVLNEPHSISWELWRNGGEVSDTKPNSDALAENKEIITSFHSPGIQGLVAAIRGTGAKNVIVAGGLDWSYDLSGILTGYALDDLGGNGIVYDTHVYPWKSDWQHKFLDVAKVHPVLLGEVGCDKTRYAFIPPERFENPYTWAPDMIACIQREKLHWTAWAFHPHCGPPMLLDVKDFTPTPFWGAFVRAALLGGRFQSDKLR